MLYYAFTSTPHQPCLGLYIHREYNENVPPHDRYHWYLVLLNESRTDVSCQLKHMDSKEEEFVVQDPTGQEWTINLEKMTFNGKSICRYHHFTTR